jgi:hypothetical protein
VDERAAHRVIARGLHAGRQLGATSQIEKEKSAALRSFLDGKKRLISASSFYEHLITRLILSHPVDASAPKGTQTSTRFKPRSQDLEKMRNSEAGRRPFPETVAARNDR